MAAMIVATRSTLCMISFIVVPATAVSWLPASIRAPEFSISNLISRAAVEERCARLRTSPATTAKPRPCSPARAASTAAFKASRLVWKAMPSMTAVISAMFLAKPLMARIVSTTSDTTLPPRPATCVACLASSFASWAWALFCLTAAVSCSTDEAVSSRAPAWCSVRRDKSPLPDAMSFDATSIAPAPSLTFPTVVARRVVIPSRASSNSPISSVLDWRGAGRKSPPAMRTMTLTASRSGLTMLRVSIHANTHPIDKAKPPSPISRFLLTANCLSDSRATRVDCRVCSASSSARAPV